MGLGESVNAARQIPELESPIWIHTIDGIAAKAM
jgi:hypothetical protein